MCWTKLTCPLLVSRSTCNYTSVWGSILSPWNHICSNYYTKSGLTGISRMPFYPKAVKKLIWDILITNESTCPDHIKKIQNEKTRKYTSPKVYHSVEMVSNENNLYQSQDREKLKEKTKISWNNSRTLKRHNKITQYTQMFNLKRINTWGIPKKTKV